MRADGVLRVILNASLYVGMTCLEDGKHVRTTVFEGGERRFITIRVRILLPAICLGTRPLTTTRRPPTPRWLPS